MLYSGLRQSKPTAQEQDKTMVKVIEQIQKAYEVIELNIFGGGQGSLIVKSGSRLFAVCYNPTDFNIYQCYFTNNEYAFLPSTKTGKTKKTVDNFIAARA